MRTVWLIALLALSGPVRAETIYVNDLLRVGVRSEPGSGEAPLAVVTTGTELQVLERRGGAIKVITPDGVEGWVNNVYVTGEKPARLRIKALQAEYATLQDELDEVRSQSTDLLDENERVARTVKELRRENGTLHARIGKLYTQTAEEGDDRWWLFPSTLILLFLFGVFLGARWYRQRIAQRLGGLQL